MSDLVATGGLSFDDKTGVLTNDGTGGTLSINMPSDGIDFSNFTSFTVNRSGDDVINNSEIKDEKNSISNGFWGSKYGVNFTTGDAMKFNTATNVNVINFYGNNTAGTMTISSITVKANVLTCTLPGAPVVLNTLQYYKMDGTVDIATWNVGTSSATYYGSGESGATNYVDLTEYEELRIHRNDNTAFRAFFINAAGNGTNQIDNNTTEIVSWNESEKYWVIDLSKVEKYNGKMYLNTIKSRTYDTSDIVNNITVYKTPEGSANYILAGNGTFTPTTVAALADAKATLIDATGVTGTGITFTSANPNCIFLANDGVLANTENVMVGTTIANLNITDGYPLSIPTGATATAATYTRPMTNKYGTICLPYAVSSDGNVKYYTIKSLDGDELTLQKEATLAAGTPAIVEKLTGSSITAAGSGALAQAGAPTGDLKLIGTYDARTILASDYASKNIYAISNNQFVQATNSINLPAFRAYFVNTVASPASLRLGFAEEDDATAINALSNEGTATVASIYSLGGAQLPSLQKGVNVVKFLLFVLLPAIPSNPIYRFVFE